MRILCFLMFMAWPLGAVTIIDLPAGRILPGSHIDVVTEGESADYEFITEGGFSLSGSSWAPFQGPYALGEPLGGHSGFAETLWENSRSGYFFEITMEEPPAVAGLEALVNAPFSLVGVFFDAPTEDPPYYQADFYGSGTAYFSLVHYNFPEEGLRIEIDRVRYEFEAAPIPEPSTWGLMLAGLLALRRLRRGARVAELESRS